MQAIANSQKELDLLTALEARARGIMAKHADQPMSSWSRVEIFGDSPFTTRLNDQLAAYVTFAAGVLGVEDPKTLPQVVVADKWSGMLAAGIDNPDDELYGAFYPDPIAGPWLYIREDIANSPSPVLHSVIVHELTHYVDYASGNDPLGKFAVLEAPADFPTEELNEAHYRAEKNAYEVQARWLWQQGINPREFPALSRENLISQTNDPAFAELPFLNGYKDDGTDWNSFWRARKFTAGNMFTDDPKYSLAAFKRGEFKAQDPIQALLQALLNASGGDSRFCINRQSPKPMDDLDAILIAEGGAQCADEYIAAFQHLLDTGLVWQLQGWYGRTAKDLLDRGEIHRHD